MVDITEISAIVAAAGVLVGVVIAVMELRNIVRARQGELFLDLYYHYNNPEFVRRFSDAVFNWSWKDYSDWHRRFSPEANIEVYSSWAAVGNYFKGVGILVEEKMIDVRLVDKLMGEPFRKYWEKCESIIKEFRKEYKLPKAWEATEHLYNEIKKIEQAGVKNG